jgi:uncharacterized protein involved in outer membrane biogenesis
VGRAVLQRAGTALGARLEARDFRFSVLRGLLLDQVRAAGRYPGGGFELDVERVVFRHRLLPLLRRRLAVDEVRVERPHLVLTEGRATAASPSPGPPAPAVPVPLRLQVARIAVVDGVVEMRTRGDPVAVRGLGLRLRDLSADPAASTALAGLAAAGDLTIDRIQLPATNVRDLSGTLRLADGRLEASGVTFRTDEGPFTGTWAADLRRLPFTYSIALEGTPLDLNAMARAAAGGGRLGPARLKLEGRGVGPEPTGLTATGVVHLDKGTLPATPLLLAVERTFGRTRLSGTPYQAADTPFRIERGRVSFEGFRLQTEQGTLEVGGWAALDGGLDLHAALRVPRDQVRIAEVPTQALDALTDDAGFVLVPFRVTGTREAPRVMPDVAEMLAQAQRGGVRALAGKVGDKVRGLFRR